MTTTTEKKELQARAVEFLQLSQTRVENGLLLITQDRTTNASMTDYLRVILVTSDPALGRPVMENLTWAVAHGLGYRLTDGMAGNHRLAIGGYGYSKPLDVVINLARFYGLNDYALNYQTL